MKEELLTDTSDKFSFSVSLLFKLDISKAKEMIDCQLTRPDAHNFSSAVQKNIDYIMEKEKNEETCRE